MSRKDKEEKKMIANKKELKKTITVGNETVTNVAKLGMKKYRKTLDKLAKN
jgi:hypothetical protein